MHNKLKTNNSKNSANENSIYKKVYIIFVFLFFAVFIICISLFITNDQLEAEVWELEKEAWELDEEASELDEEASELEEETSELEKEVSELEKEVSELEEEVSELNTVIANWASDYSLLKQQYDFFDEFARIVPDDGSGLYHRYTCSELDVSSFWIYNVDAVIDYASPCQLCCEND